MTKTTFDDLLIQADASARQGDWQSTLELLQDAVRQEPEHTGALTGIGSCLVQLGRAQEAIAAFDRVVSLAPDSPQAYNNLGVANTLLRRWPEAESAFRQAISLDPDHLPAWKNLALVQLEQGQYGEGVQILAALVQANPEDAEALWMLGQCYEEAGDLASAGHMYREALKYQPELENARQGLERVSQATAEAPAAGSGALPANSARIARPEHASKLAALKGLRKSGTPRPTPAAEPPAASNGNGSARPAIAFLGPPEAATEMRLSPVIQALVQNGRRVKVSLSLADQDLETCQIFCFSRPHTSPELLEAVERCARAGKRVIVDLDVDFHQLPEGWPGYEKVGPGNPEALTRLERALTLADLVTAASPLLVERYRPFARQIELLFPGWSRANPLWEKSSQPRDTFNIGVMGTHVQPKDAQLLKQDLARLMKEFPQALAVFSFNVNLFEVFSTIRDDRLLFLPVGRLDDYPYLLSNYDILLVPLQDNPYNAALSDVPLLEAGIRGLPWVASPVASFREWGAGGLFAEKSGDWYEAVKRLITDPNLRRNLAAAGKQKAEEREMGAAAGWDALFR